MICYILRNKKAAILKKGSAVFVYMMKVNGVQNNTFMVWNPIQIIKAMPLETDYGREMNIQFTGNSSGGYSWSQHANCTLPQNLWHL